MLQLPQKQIISILLKEKATDNLGKGGFLKDITMILAIKGKSCSVTLNPKPKKSVNFSEESLHNLQTYLGHSNLAMKKMCLWLRVHAGRQAIPPYIRSAIASKGRTMKDLF